MGRPVAVCVGTLLCSVPKTTVFERIRGVPKTSVSETRVSKTNVFETRLKTHLSETVLIWFLLPGFPTKTQKRTFSVSTSCVGNNLFSLQELFKIFAEMRFP
jgi:hypothetical protein